MEQVYYKKVVEEDGVEKYIPVRAYDSRVHDAYPLGFSLVYTKPNGASYKYGVDPAVAPLVAATMLLKDELTKIIYKAGHAEIPASSSEEAQRIWNIIKEELP